MLKLPIELNPKIKSYQYVAFPMSIIEANGKENIIPWLCTKCIKCCFDMEPRQNRFLICLNDSYGKTDNILKHQHISMDKSTYKAIGINYVEFLKTLISDENYITGYCNERYISSKAAYEKHDYMHDYLIYGYDEIESIFYSLGYTNSMHYEEYKIPYNDFVNSILFTNTDQIEFNAWKYNKNNNYSLNLNNVIKDLEEYALSIYSGDGWKNSYLFGLNAMKALSECFKQTENVDIRYTRAYMEHKYLMLQRLEYIEKTKGCNISKCIKTYKEIYKSTIIIHNLSIKYNITQNKKLLDSILSYMCEIWEYENKNINDIIIKFKNL